MNKLILCVTFLVFSTLIRAGKLDVATVDTLNLSKRAYAFISGDDTKEMLTIVSDENTTRIFFDASDVQFDQEKPILSTEFSITADRYFANDAIYCNLTFKKKKESGELQIFIREVLRTKQVVGWGIATVSMRLKINGS